MLPSILMTSALAAAVVASPLQHLHKRVYETVTAEPVTEIVAVETVTVTLGAGQSPPAQIANKEEDQAAPGAPEWGSNPAFGPGHGGPPGGWGDHTDHGSPPVTTQAQQPPANTQPPVNTQSPEQPPPAPTSKPATGAPPSQPPSSNDPYQNMVIKNHNIHRANQSGTDPIAWSAELAASAQQIAASCVYAHNTDVGNLPIGQNIAAGVEGSAVDRIITNMFYNGEVNYFAGQYGKQNPDMTNFEKWGHFSQLVWKATTHVGCYTQHCPGGLANTGSDVSPYFTVCNYNPPGNFAGAYNVNIGDPGTEPTVTIE